MCLATMPRAVTTGPFQRSLAWPSWPFSPGSYPEKFSLRYSGPIGCRQTGQMACSCHRGPARVAQALGRPCLWAQCNHLQCCVPISNWKFTPRLKGPIDRSWELHPQGWDWPTYHGHQNHPSSEEVTRLQTPGPSPETWTWLVCSGLKNPALDSARRPWVSIPAWPQTISLEKS